MGLRLIDIVSDYKTIIANDGQVSKDKLLEMLELDYEVPKRFQNNEGYNIIADRILDVKKRNRAETSKRRLELHLKGYTLKEIANAEKKTKEAILYWYKINSLHPNVEVIRDESNLQ